MNSKSLYSALCEKENIPIFSQSWWLDVVAGSDNWDVVCVKKGSEVRATLPFFVRKRSGFKVLSMPPLTQTLGPWFSSMDEKTSVYKRLQKEKELTEKLIQQLPSFSLFQQNFHSSIDFWLPWYWKGFQQTTRYTYLIEDTSNLDVLWNNLKGSIRRNIKKSEERFQLKISKSYGDNESALNTFLKLNQKTFQRKEMTVPYSEKLVRRLSFECAKRNCCKILLACDQNNIPYAGALIIWDQFRVYYLLGGIDSQYKTSGAMSLVLWEAIKIAHKKNLIFDFEGSMIEPIENLFRSFGATPIPYFSINKASGFIPSFALSTKKLLASMNKQY